MVAVDYEYLQPGILFQLAKTLGKRNVPLVLAVDGEIAAKDNVFQPFILRFGGKRIECCVQYPVQVIVNAVVPPQIRIKSFALIL